MTITSAGESVTTGAARADFLAAIAEIGAYFKAHEDAPPPDCTTLGYEVPTGLTPDQKLAWLRGIARVLAVPVTVENGVHSAYREFPPVRIGAHVDLGATGTIAWLNAAKARRAGTETAA